MTLALTNLDLLHRGWEDAVLEITPHLPEVRATMETEYAGLLHDGRIDEQALLAAVRQVAGVAARAAGADKARLLSRSMHRSLYEYLLSLDALTLEEPPGDADNGGVDADPSRLIGMEEVAELEGRQAALRAEEEAAAAALAAAEQLAAERAEAERAEAERVAAEERAEAERVAAEAERVAAEERAEAERVAAEQQAAAERAAAERAAAEQAAAERAAAHRVAAERAASERAAAERAVRERAEAEAQRVAAEERAAAERAAADSAALEAEAAARANELPGVDPAHAGDVEQEPAGETSGGFYRPRFKLFRRGSTDDQADGDAGEREAAHPASPSWWRGPEAPPVRLEPEVEPAAAPDQPIRPAAHTEPAASLAPDGPRATAPRRDSGFAVQPRDGFHLTEFADFVRPTPHAAPQPDTEAPEEPGSAADEDGAKARGWHIRSSRRSNAGEADEAETDEALDEEAWEERRLIDSDPKVAQANGEINDLLRRRKCDEAASLLQKLAADRGNRSVAELALDAGDRCRALGKGNAALSCYIAASRADPSFEGPLMRLADVCLDDRDIDLAVTYLERVAKLHRQRGDTRGALRLYRKIATIAPYRDDILATLMRANSTGQFED